ncbi:hypothetical protein KX928_03905 [Roseobacter sp. YSTF-M11]|uniref:Uncharacterized protein n=1 Tax=Roseobacter insulae TaxID=2859783 RepID=A0A9X1FSQ3_9RHOB|nr:hypothetical protein [Roseobacter insulae]MBW4706927.1 hypothetical protein [Roseobacter insulae]
MNPIYGQDSFFTLSLAGQVGLAALSGGFALAMIWLSWRLTRNRAAWLRGITAVALFWFFIWLSPQAYYFYYLLVFDGLPAQWVVRSPATPSHLLRLLTFTADASLSHHGQGFLGWGMLVAGLWPQRHPTSV